MAAQTADDFIAHTRFSDPGRHAAQLAALPTDLPTLHTILNGLLLHE